jgi:hypothetical protein
VTDELEAVLAGVGGDEHRLAALMVVARLHRPQDVEEFCPASFGDPCTDAERFEHRDVGDGALVHAGVFVRRECATCTDEDNQPAEHPCEEYRAVLQALGQSQR